MKRESFYTLYLHGKQGDDLAAHLESTSNLPSALRQWADAFEAARDACRAIAMAVDGKKISVIADTHYICFEAADRDSIRILEGLVKTGLLHKSTEALEE